MTFDAPSCFSVVVTGLGNILHMIRAARTVWVSKLRRRDAQSRSEPRGNPGEFLENSTVNATGILMAVSLSIYPYRFTLGYDYYTSTLPLA